MIKEAIVKINRNDLCHDHPVIIHTSDMVLAPGIKKRE